MLTRFCAIVACSGSVKTVTLASATLYGGLITSAGEVYNFLISFANGQSGFMVAQ